MAVESRTRWKLGAIGFVIFFVLVLVGLRDALLPLFVAFGLAYAFSPIVDALQHRGVPRTLSVLAILMILVGLLALLVATLVPKVVNEMQSFIHDFPQLLSSAVTRVADFARPYGIAVPTNVDTIMTRLRSAVQGGGDGPSVNAGVAAAAAHFFVSVAGVITAFLDFLIVPFFFFFTCRDFRRARGYVFNLVPPRHQVYARHVFTRIDDVLSGYIRGQMVMAAILGTVYGIALSLLHLRFGLFIGVLAGFLNIIPYVGQFTGLSMSLLMGLVDYEGMGRIVGILAVFAVTHLIESNFISPRIIGDRVGLQPLWIILALIVGGKIAGLGGMIIAVPMAGVLKVLFGEIVLKYKSSGFYREHRAVSDAHASRIKRGEVSST